MVRFHRNGGITMDTTDHTARAFVYASMYDRNRSKIFIQGMLGSSFERGWCEQRDDFLRWLSDYTVPQWWAMARRGMGKTSLTLGELLRVVCLRLHWFILYTTNDQNLSEERTESLRTMVTSTPELIDLFGDLRPQSVDGMKQVFGARSWRLCDPFTGEPYIAVVPKSEGQTVNGLLLYVDGQIRRPNYILNDDGEDRRKVKNETLRRDHREWMQDVLLQTVDTDFQPPPDTRRWPQRTLMDKVPYTIRITDTDKHTDAYLPRLAEAPKDAGNGTKFWEGKCYPAAEQRADGSFRSLAPEILSDEQIAAKYLEFEANGNPEGFWREWMCRSTVPGQTDAFPASFQYYQETELRLNERGDVDRFIICDPALTENATSAFSSMLAVAVDRTAARIYLRRQITERMTPDQFDDALFKLGRDMNTTWYLIEGLKSNNRFRDDMIRAAMKRGVTAAFESLSTHTGNIIDIDVSGPNAAKRRRAVFAVRLYRPFAPTHLLGHVWHEESLRDSALEGQEKSYPNCSFWDALDCVGHIPQAMKVLGIYFDYQNPEEDEEKRQQFRGAVSMFGRRIAAGAWRVCP